LFDQEWQQQHVVITLLCLAALSGLYVDTHCNILRAQKAYQYELYTRLFCLCISSLSLLFFEINTPEDLGLVVLSSSIIWLLVLFFKPIIIPNPSLKITLKKESNA
jgi:hypothetical protein